MDFHAVEFYSTFSEEKSQGHFHRVIALHEEPFFDWNEASQLAPKLCRGWYELAKLPIQDRIEFTREFWISKLPYHPNLSEFLVKFFGSLDDLGVFLTQKKYEDPFDVCMVYSLENNSGFFQGVPPSQEEEIIALQKEFLEYILPVDYLAFLQIHNGFAKLTDTGIFKSSIMKSQYDSFQAMLMEQNNIMTSQGASVNPRALIPFYQSFELPFYQCFWGEWYPDQEMGNVYYSGSTQTIFTCLKRADSDETMAFESFIEWLMFYLEKIE